MILAATMLHLTWILISLISAGHICLFSAFHRLRFSVIGMWKFRYDALIILYRTRNHVHRIMENSRKISIHDTDSASRKARQRLLWRSSLFGAACVRWLAVYYKLFRSFTLCDYRAWFFLLTVLMRANGRDNLKRCFTAAGASSCVIKHHILKRGLNISISLNSENFNYIIMIKEITEINVLHDDIAIRLQSYFEDKTQLGKGMSES